MAWDYWPAIEPGHEGKHCEICDMPIDVIDGPVAFEWRDVHDLRVAHGTCYRAGELQRLAGRAEGAQHRDALLVALKDLRDLAAATCRVIHAYGLHEELITEIDCVGQHVMGAGARAEAVITEAASLVEGR